MRATQGDLVSMLSLLAKPQTKFGCDSQYVGRLDGKCDCGGDCGGAGRGDSKCRVFSSPFYGAIVGLTLLASACSTGGSSSSAPPPSSFPTPITNPPPPNFNTAEFQENPGLIAVNALPAYDEGADGAGALVAIIDTGIDVDNPEFAGRIDSRSEDLVKPGIVDAADLRPGGPNLEDQDGHGTAVAGIIAAARNDSGVHGVAPEADILAFRADDEVEELVILGGPLGEGLILAADAQADVLNLSLGSDEIGARADFRFIFDFTSQEDIVTAIAAGNNGALNPEQSALAAIDTQARDTVIIVGSVDANNVISSFSDRAGIAASHYLVAPGEDVPTVFANGPANTLLLFTGTSAATPYVSGAAALIRGLWPQLTAQEVVEILLETATDLGAPGTDAVYGRGLLNIGAALEPAGASTTANANGSSVSVPSSVSVTNAVQSGFISAPVFGGALPDLGEFAFVDAYGRDYVASFDGFVAGPTGLSFDPLAAQNPYTYVRHQSTAFAGGSLHMRLEREDASFTDRDVALRAGAGQEVFGFNDGALGHGGNQASDSGHDVLLDEELSFAFSQSLSPQSSYWVAKGYAPRDADRLAAFAAGLATPRGRTLSRDGFSDGFLVSTDDAVSTLMQWRTDKPLTFDVLAVQALDGTGGNLRAGATKRIKGGHIRFELGALSERDALLGAQLGDLLSEGGLATTSYLSLSGARALPLGWRAYGRFGFGATSLRSNDGLAAGVRGLRTMQAALGLARTGVMTPSDQIRFSLSQPLQAISGDLTLVAPIAYDAVNQRFIFEERRAGLSAERRNIDLEAAYILGDVFGGVVEVNLIHQWAPDIYTDRAMAALIRGGFAF